MSSSFIADGAEKLYDEVQTPLSQLHQVHVIIFHIILSTKRGALQNCNRLLPPKTSYRLAPGENKNNLDFAVQLV